MQPRPTCLKQLLSLSLLPLLLSPMQGTRQLLDLKPDFKLEKVVNICGEKMWNILLLDLTLRNWQGDRPRPHDGDHGAGGRVEGQGRQARRQHAPRTGQTGKGSNFKTSIFPSQDSTMHFKDATHSSSPGDSCGFFSLTYLWHLRAAPDRLGTWDTCGSPPPRWGRH